MKAVYLDASAIIYLIEGEPELRAAVARHLDAVRATPDGTLLTSRLSMLECRTRPLRDKDSALLASYDAFFSAKRLRVLELDAGVVSRATEIRARYALRTPDALHVATALEAGADVLLTGDEGFRRCPEVVVEIVSPLRG